MNWHWRKVTVAEAEARHPGNPDVPRLQHVFGGLHSEWEALKAAMQPGDELYAFESSPGILAGLGWPERFRSRPRWQGGAESRDAVKLRATQTAES